MSPTVGVVIPAYQAQQWLPMTLASLRAQTFTDWVAVVVDDGSSDDTARLAQAVAAQDSRITVVTQPNGGLPNARNAGLRALPDVELLAFLDSDDLWLPTSLTSMVGALEQRADAVGCYGLAEYIDAAGERLDAGVHPARQRQRRRYVGGRWRGALRPVAPAEDLTFAEMVVVNPFWPPATGLVRARTVTTAGGFDDSYRVQEDWHLWMRVAMQGPFVALDAVTAEYRRHGENLTLNDALNTRNQARMRAETWRSAPPPQADVLAGAWRVLLRSRLFHHVWLVSRGLRDRDPALVLLATCVLCALGPQLLLPGPPVPGRVFDLVRRWEVRADARVRARP